MMNEVVLKPCPFCGSTESFPSKHKENCWVRLYGQKLSDYRANPLLELKPDSIEMTDAWNTRYKRTCKNLSHDRIWLMCSECGAFTKVTNATNVIPASQCGNCGAEVRKVLDE